VLWRTGRPAKRPGTIEPCIPTRVSKPPVAADSQIKHDGYRLIARKRDGRVRLFTRRCYDWTERYPRTSAAVAALRPASVMIDGEAVSCDDAGGNPGHQVFEPRFARFVRSRSPVLAVEFEQVEGVETHRYNAGTAEASTMARSESCLACHLGPGPCM
jgi:ATP-dependent DNA ligase